MKKLDNYENAQAITGDFEILEPGGYLCKILKTEEQKSRTGKRMLVIFFDIAEGEHKDFYMRRFESDTRESKKYLGTYNQMLEGEKAPGYFKGIITSLEESNSKFKWNWNEEKLKGLLFGGIFGREEYENMYGERKMNTKLIFIRSIQKVKSNDFTIPKDKMLPIKGEAFEGFMNTPTENGDDLPF